MIGAEIEVTDGKEKMMEMVMQTVHENRNSSFDVLVANCFDASLI